MLRHFGMRAVLRLGPPARYRRYKARGRSYPLQTRGDAVPIASALQNVQIVPVEKEMVGSWGLEPQTWPTGSARSNQLSFRLEHESCWPISSV